MILIDDREKQASWVSYMSQRNYTFSRMEFGDASFVGNGPDECPILIGIERKSIGDLLNCITSGRFSGHQLPGLTNSYGVVYMVVEGMYRPNANNGLLELRLGKEWNVVERGQKWMYNQVEGWLTTIEEKAGVRIRRAPTPHETAVIIQSLHQWWTSKDYADHHSHIALHTTPDVALLRKAGLVRTWAAELPGVGWSKSIGVERKFHTPVEMVIAEVEEWMEIEGIGRNIAEKVVGAIYGISVDEVRKRKG